MLRCERNGRERLELAAGAAAGAGLVVGSVDVTGWKPEEVEIVVGVSVIVVVVVVVIVVDDVVV